MSEERRKNMDAESKKEFKEVKDKLNHIELSLTEMIAFNKGLDVKNRLTHLEDEVEKKASWNGLYLSVAAFVAILTVALVIAKGVS